MTTYILLCAKISIQDPMSLSALFQMLEQILIRNFLYKVDNNLSGRVGQFVATSIALHVQNDSGRVDGHCQNLFHNMFDAIL